MAYCVGVTHYSNFNELIPREDENYTMFTKRHATLANASILLYFAALASGIVLRSGHVNTLRSCSSLFTYQTRPDDGRTYGLIIVAQPFAEMLADGRMLLDVWLQADGIVPKVNISIAIDIASD